jgi:hypothetical protein
VSLKSGVNLKNRRAVLTALAAFCLVIFGAGMWAAWLSRHDTICKDGKPPIRQRSGTILPTEYLCHNGQVVKK